MEKHLVDFNSGKAAVWKYFGFWKSGETIHKDKAVCRICNVEYVYTGNTTTLRNHMMAKHYYFAGCKTSKLGTFAICQATGIKPGCL